MSDQWTDRLSEYLDGDLKGSERALLEAHLERCDDCQETLASLRRVLMRARSLEDRPPAADLWAGVAERIGVPARTVALPARRRFTFSLPQLLAAGDRSRRPLGERRVDAAPRGADRHPDSAGAPRPGRT